MYRLMLIIVLMVGALAACAPAGGQPLVVADSGVLVSREIPASGFDRVEASHSFQVEIRQGETFQVVVRVDRELEDYLDVVQRGDTLKIGLKPNYQYRTQGAAMQAEVTMPELAGLELSGASQASLHNLKIERDLQLGLSGSSAVRGSIRAADTAVHLSGSSQVVLSGAAGDLSIHASGASDVELSDLTAADGEIHASGACRISVNVSGRLGVNASGATWVSYQGDPTLTRVQTSGTATLVREG